MIIFSNKNINSLFLILSTNVKNNFIKRGLSSIINSFSTESKSIKTLSPHSQWVTGFSDAEGSFIISVYKRNNSNNWQIKPSFEVGLHSKDINTLQKFKDYFGVGIINTRISKNVTSFTVTKLNDLVNVIIPHFSNFPLQTQKRIDFELWAKIVESKKNKEHLTHEGLLKILSLKSALNRGLSKTTSEIKNIKVLERPLHLVDSVEFLNIDPNWISGFVAGDGSFDIKITNRKSKYQVELRFRITQHIRDAHILGVIAEYLGCGKVYIRSTGLACDLVVINFPDNINKIIPFFNKHPIGTIKENDFKDFILAAELITNKAHLTLEGLAKLKEIKLNMNNLRIKE